MQCNYKQQWMWHKWNETAAHLMTLSSDWTWDLYSAKHSKFHWLPVAFIYDNFVSGLLIFTYTHAHKHAHTHTHMRTCPDSSLYWGCRNNSNGLTHSACPSGHYAAHSAYVVIFFSSHHKNVSIDDLHFQQAIWVSWHMPDGARD